MIRVSARIPMVGLPEMRRGSFTLVTRPSTMAPAGIRVLPFSTTACVSCPRKGSPALLLKVASVVSSLTINAVPAGTGELVCAAAIAASNTRQTSTVHFFITPPRVFQPFNLPIVALTLDQPDGEDNSSRALGTTEDKGCAKCNRAGPEGKQACGRSNMAAIFHPL